VKNGRAARVVLVDDHDLARAGLREVLADEPLVEVVAEASDGEEAVELCARVRPDLVLMDVRMPRMDGLEATRAIKRGHPKVGVLMVTMHEDPDYLLEALKAGAAGYVLKDASREEVVSAVLRAHSGDSPLDAGLATELLKRLVEDSLRGRAAAPGEPGRKPSALQVEPLTRRELEVLELLARGHTNRQAAETLTLSAGTVKRHVENILAKLGVSDRTQAAVRAYQLKLIGPNRR
jgi:DNA-binding NarL/FixJ family response regulator